MSTSQTASNKGPRYGAFCLIQHTFLFRLPTVSVEDICTAAHSPKGDEAHPRHNVTDERTFDTSQLGEVTNADVTRHYHSLLTTPIDDSPACPHPPLSFQTQRQQPSRHQPNTTQRQSLRTDTDVLSRTPARTTNPEVSNPTPVCTTQRQCVCPNTSVSSLTWVSTTQRPPTPACTIPIPTCRTQELCFEPNTGVCTPMPVNGRRRGFGGNLHRHRRGPYHSRGGGALIMYIASCTITWL
jgi:hypothetical protein